MVNGMLDCFTLRPANPETASAILRDIERRQNFLHGHEDMLDVVYANFVLVYGRPKRPTDAVTVAPRYIKHVDWVSEFELHDTSNASDNGLAVSLRAIRIANFLGELMSVDQPLQIHPRRGSVGRTKRAGWIVEPPVRVRVDIPVTALHAK